MKEQRKLTAVVTIVDRGQGSAVSRIYTEHQVFTHLRCEGSGTATSEILDILGIGASEKDILFSLAPEDTVHALFACIRSELHGRLGRGIAFTVELTAVSSLLAAIIAFKTKPEKEGGETAMPKTDNQLLLLSVNQGFADEVMTTARRSGARGGTILRGRWVGQANFEVIYPDVHQAEKEIIAIVAPNDKAAQIMESVNREHGMQKSAGAVICALGIDRMEHLS